MTDTTDGRPRTGTRARLFRYSLAGALLASGVIALAAVLLLDGDSGHARALANAGGGAGQGVHRSGGSPATAAPATPAGSAVKVALVADPQESKSFPVPASVRHATAAAPAKAGELAVAAGAPSDAEVRRELAQMQAAEQAAKQTQQRQLTPVPGGESVGGNGTIPLPTGAPEAVQRVIAGANAIADFPYVFGGGHASFVDNAYDCSGSVSYALAAGGLLAAPETSGELESWGVPGPGRYISVYATAGHTYMYVDGILYDTAGRSGPFASRWQVLPVDNTGYVVRHWQGL